MAKKYKLFYKSIYPASDHTIGGRQFVMSDSLQEAAQTYVKENLELLGFILGGESASTGVDNQAIFNVKNEDGSIRISLHVRNLNYQWVE